MKPRTFDAEQLERLTKALANSIIDAGIHYRLYRDLVADIPQFRRVFNEAPAFWTLTFVAHRDAAVIRLCRAFDTEKRAVGLSRWLGVIGSHKQLFSEAAFRRRLASNADVESLATVPRLPDDAQLAKDVAFAGRDNALVKKLLFLRNNIYAHQSIGHAFDPTSFMNTHNVDAEDLWFLINGALEIINRYSTLFQARSYSPTIVGHDDYRSVLRGMARDMRAQHAKVMAEYRAAGGTDYPDEEDFREMSEE